MATYKVFASMHLPYEVEVEAASAQQAYDIAKGLDQDCFNEAGEVGYNGMWVVSPNNIMETDND